MLVRKLRTDDWPERDRLALFRENFGGDRVRVEPLPEQPLRIDATLTRMAGVGLVWGRRSALSSHYADGNDRLILSLGCSAVGHQFGREIELESGDAVALSGADCGAFTTLQTGRIITVEFGSGALLQLVRDPAASFGRRIPKNLPALRLLRSYLRSFISIDPISGFEQLAGAHILDLVALTVGANREVQEVAGGRGVAGGRLAAIKADILANLHNELALSDLAARYRLSSRYVRMLFERHGSSFSEFVREERLRRAHQMLLSPRHAHLNIGAIAFEVGFNDLSYFNRCFRRRFSASPTQIRDGRNS
jgi:AraC-like DNA-binding protein